MIHNLHGLRQGALRAPADRDKSRQTHGWICKVADDENQNEDKQDNAQDLHTLTVAPPNAALTRCATFAGEPIRTTSNPADRPLSIPASESSMTSARLM